VKVLSELQTGISPLLVLLVPLVTAKTRARPKLTKMPFLTLQEIEWISMEMEHNPKAFLPYQDINAFSVLKIPPGAEAECNHKAMAKTPWKVLGKRPSDDLLIKAFLQTKRRQEHIDKPQLN
jgi:hypothetical protein